MFAIQNAILTAFTFFFFFSYKKLRLHFYILTLFFTLNLYFIFQKLHSPEHKNIVMVFILPLYLEIYDYILKMLLTLLECLPFKNAALTAFIYFYFYLFIYFIAAKISALTNAINFFSLMALNIFYFTVILFYFIILFKKFHLSEHRNS